MKRLFPICSQIILVCLLLSTSGFAKEQMNVVKFLRGRKLCTASKHLDGNSALKGKKVVALYFSAHWCGPCRAFTPQLVDFYEKCQRKKLPFEVVFVSSDKNASEMASYMKEMNMPWPAVPFKETQIRADLKSQFGINGIPTLVILDSKGEIISPNGRWDVVAHGVNAYTNWLNQDYVSLTYHDITKKGKKGRR